MKKMTSLCAVLRAACLTLLLFTGKNTAAAAGNEPQYDSNGLLIENGVLKNIKDRDNVFFLEIPEGVTEIASYSLSYMKNLSCISLPSSLKAVGYRAFEGTYHIRVIYHPGTYTEYRKINAYTTEQGEGGYKQAGIGNLVERNADVYCNGKRVTSLRVIRVPDQTVCLTNSEYRLEGMVLRAEFNDGSTEDINKYTKVFSTPDKFANDGVQPVTVYYGGVKANYSMMVQIPLYVNTGISSQSVTLGSEVTFNAKSSGKDLRYKWFRRNLSENRFTELTDKKTGTFTLKADKLLDGAFFYCTVTDAYGNVKSTNIFSITVTDALRILQQPAENFSLKTGDSLNINVRAKGEGLQYQWYFKKKDASDWTLWKGHTENTCCSASNKSWDGMRVRCRITDGKGDSLTSRETLINVTDALAITSPLNDIYTATNRSTPFQLSAKGKSLKYQWYYKKLGASDWSVWNGRIAYSMYVTANSTWNGMQVRCTVTDADGDTVTSNAATVFLTDVFTILRQPKSVTLRDGELAEFSVMASGNSLKYQWYFKKKGASGWTLWNSHNTAKTSAISNATWNGMQVRCKVTNVSGASLTSAAATVTIADIIRITSQPADIAVISGKTASFAVKATGSDLKYQWYFKKKGDSGWTLWKGHTSAQTSATSNDSWDGMRVKCRITNASGAVLYSNEAAVTIARDTVKLIAQPKNVTTVAGRKVSFSVGAAGNSLKYQWYYKKKGAADWSIWRIYTAASIEPPSNSTWDGMQVRCTVTDAYGCSVTSNAASVTLIPAEESDFAILSHPQDVHLTRGYYRTTSFFVEAKGTGLSYRWYYIKRNQPNWNLWPKHTSAVVSVIPNDTWEDMQVYCVITNERGEELYSDIAKVYFE